MFQHHIFLLYSRLGVVISSFLFFFFGFIFFWVVGRGNSQNGIDYDIIVFVLYSRIGKEFLIDGIEHSRVDFGGNS